VRVLAEIPPPPSPGLRAGTLRRRDQEAFGGLLDRLRGARTVLALGSAKRPVALGLATAAAARGTRTALVECDLAEPALAGSLGLATAPGLSEHLRGEADAASLLKPAVLAGPGSAAANGPLVCVVAGRPSADGWALLASDGFRQALDGLRSAYELVVLDGPSLREEHAVRSLLPLADTAIGCLGPAEPRKLPVPVGGAVIQG
jgi:Mrp family chromosome partitioning ATPase